jgi:type I restriction enzyme S subunit
MNIPLIPTNIPENASAEEKELNSLKNIKFDYDAEPIWELAARLSAQVPQEEWAKLPTDLARNFDHYQQQDHS